MIKHIARTFLGAALTYAGITHLTTNRQELTVFDNALKSGFGRGEYFVHKSLQLNPQGLETAQQQRHYDTT